MSAPTAPVVAVRASVVVGAVVAASATAAEGKAGTEGVVVGFRASVVGWRPLAGRWGLEGVVLGAFLGWGTGVFAGFLVVGSSERVCGGCGVEVGDPVPEGVGGLIEVADVRHDGGCLMLLYGR